MTISARLSRRLYEAFGDDAASDLVDWMQQVDAQRVELRELNELNFARFTATLDDRVNKLRVDIERTRADLIKWSFVFWVGAVSSIALLAGVLK